MTETEQKTANAVPQQGETASASFNPFNEPVKKRDYTRKAIEVDMASSGEVFNEEQIPEPTYEAPSFNEGDRFSSGGGSQESPSASAVNNNPIGTASPTPQNFSSESEVVAPSINPPLEDLDAAAKKKAAKQTADVMLTAYQKFAPMPFSKISSFNMNKMNKLDMNGDISLNMIVQENGGTVKNYMEGVNSQVEEIFQVNDDMKKELKEPLVDVLMEQNMALTPTQRLMIAAGGQIVQFSAQAIQLALQNKDALKTFKNYKMEADEARPDVSSTPPQQTSGSTVQAETPESEEIIPEQETYDAPKTEEEKTSTKEEKSYEKPTFGLDEYLDGGAE